MDEAELRVHLANAEARLKALLAVTPEIAWIKDGDLRYVAVNRAFISASGYPEDRILGRSDHELWVGERAEQYIHQDKQVLDQGKPCEFETLLPSPVSERPLLLQAFKYPVIGPGGTAIGVAGFARDLSERWSLERGFSEARDFFHALLNAVADPVIVQNAACRFVLVNDSAAAFMGHPATIVLGKKPRAFFEDFQARHLEHVCQEAISQGSASREFELKSARGTVRVFSAKGKRYRNHDGALLAVTVLSDITGERSLERQLSASARFLDGVLNAIPDPIFVKDRSHRWVLLNNAFCSLLGHPREVLIGRSDPDFFPEEQAREFWRKDDVVFDSGLEDVNEEQLTGGDGKVRTIVTRKSPHSDPAGSPLLAGIIRDITDRKQAEEALRLANLKLEAANRELEAFASAASHDLQAPLRRIAGFAETLLEDCGPCLQPEDKDILGRIQKAANSMQQLVDDLLGMARTTRTEMECIPLDLGAMARQVAHALQEAEPERNVELDITSPAPATGDPRLLRQVLENIMGNAFKFTRDRSTARIKFGYSQCASGERTYFVEDNGTGFAMELGSQLFTAFRRLHREDRYPGTGLGLAIVKRIVSRHGGRVGAEGEPDRGARIWFTLP